MIRDQAYEQQRRISLKTLDHQFRKELEAGLNCSPIESGAIVELVKEVYFPYSDGSESFRPGKVVAMAVDIKEPPGRALKDCTFKRIFLIDIPMISGAIRLVVILTVIGALQGINLQFAMTNGGPGYATAVPAYYMYKMAFVGWKMGYASAIGVFLFVTIFVLSYLNMRFARSDIEFEGR